MKRTRNALIHTVSILAIVAFLSACAKQDATAEVTTPVEVAGGAESIIIPPASTPAATVDPSIVLAVVDGTDITEGDIQTELNRFMQRIGGQFPPDQIDEIIPGMRVQIMESLILQQLIRNEVVAQNVTLSDEEYATVKAELTATLPPGMDFDTQLAAMGLTEEEIREQMTLNKLIVDKAETATRPTDEEVRAFYDENGSYFTQPEMVAASHILLSYSADDTDEMKAEKRAKLEDIRQQALDGADFAELAQTHSDCPSKMSGGSLGEFGRGQMVPEFEEAAFTQEIGVVGEIIETRFGIHLILVTDRKSAGSVDFDTVSERISDMLYAQKQQEVVEGYIAGLRKNASIEIKDADLAEALSELDGND